MSSSRGDQLQIYWLPVHALAAVAATAHAVIDWHVGLFGASSSVLTPTQAGIAIGMSLITGFWVLGIGLAARGEARGHATVLVIALLWAFLGNGLVIAACPPPCADGFPYQDLTHVGSLVFGAGATWVSWKQLRQSGSTPTWLMPTLTFAVIAVVFVLEASVAG